MIESGKMMSSVHQIRNMEDGSSMLEETRVKRCLKEICYSLFVTMCEKAMIRILLDYGGEQNPVVWAMKKYPSSKNIQLYGIWVIINATYCSKLAERIVANLKCIQVILSYCHESIPF